MEITIKITGLDNLAAAMSKLADTLMVAEPKAAIEISKPNTPKPAPATKARPKTAPEPKTEEPETTEPDAEEIDLFDKEETAPEPKVDYKALREDLRKELAEIARKGKSAELKKLLAEHGVEKFSALADDQLEEFAAAARAL